MSKDKAKTRLEDLLNLLVDRMITDAGSNLPVIRDLLKMGFTSDELTLILNFPRTGVGECLLGDSAA